MGVWYPKGGFTKVRESLLAIAEKKGAKVRLNSAVSEIVTEEVDGLASAKGESSAALHCANHWRSITPGNTR